MKRIGIIAGLVGSVAIFSGAALLGGRYVRGDRPDDGRPHDRGGRCHGGEGRCGPGGHCDRERGPGRDRGSQAGSESRPENLTPTPPSDDAPEGTVLFRDGHDTDRRDGGRPVGLIASALGVEADVFRDAFSGVTPARGGRPSDAQARNNKRILMAALEKHGVTNDRLDEVSNYYRYRPETGELWRHKPATAIAIVQDGVVTGIEITQAGSGYSTPPQIEVVGHPNIRVQAELEFGTDLQTNGRVRALKLIE